MAGQDEIAPAQAMGMTPAHEYGQALAQYEAQYPLSLKAAIERAIEAEEVLCKVSPPANFDVLLHLAKNGYFGEAGEAYLASKDKIAGKNLQHDIDQRVLKNQQNAREQVGHAAS